MHLHKLACKEITFRAGWLNTIEFSIKLCQYQRKAYCMIMTRLSCNISESQSAPHHLAISLQPALTGADPVCFREYLGWWTELCSTDPSQIVHFSFVIFVNSVTRAIGVAVLGRQAAVLLISYFAVFTLSNCPLVYLCVGSSPFSSHMPSIWNERFGIGPGKSWVADGEKTTYTCCSTVLFHEKWKTSLHN